MALTLKDLLTAPSEDEILTGFLALLAVSGFPVTSWQPGARARTLARLVSTGLVKVGALLTAIAGGGFNSTAQGDWLPILSAELYDNQAYGATFALGSMQFGLSSALAGPYTITPGQLWLVWNGKHYRNTSGGTITWPVPLVLTFQAESPGAKYNSPDNALSLLTPLPGLVLQGSTITTQGTDAEAPESLRARNRGKWSTVGPAMNNAGYESATRAALAQVTRVRVQANTPSPRHIRVTVAGPSGALDPGGIATIQAYLDLHAALNTIPEVVNATEQAVALVGTVRITASHPNSAQAFGQVIDALLRLFAVLPIGGTLRLGDLYQVIENVPGVDSSLLASPVGDLVLPASSVAVPDLSGLVPAYT